MRADDTAAGLSVLAACTADVRQCYMQNGLQLNPHKSEARVVYQLRAVTSVVSTVFVASIDLPLVGLTPADDRMRLGAFLNSTMPSTRILR